MHLQSLLGPLKSPPNPNSHALSMVFHSSGFCLIVLSSHCLHQLSSPTSTSLPHAPSGCPKCFALCVWGVCKSRQQNSDQLFQLLSLVSFPSSPSVSLLLVLKKIGQFRLSFDNTISVNNASLSYASQFPISFQEPSSPFPLPTGTSLQALSFYFVGNVTSADLLTFTINYIDSFSN